MSLYGSRADFIEETSRELHRKGILAGKMWDRAVELGGNDMSWGPILFINENNQAEWGMAVQQVVKSNEYKTKTTYIKQRLKEGTSRQGFLNIEFNDSDDLAYSIHGAQLHYRETRCGVIFQVVDDYNFDKTHMWKKLQDDGYIIPYGVIIQLPEERLSDE